MTVLSSHVLDATNGTSAVDFRVQLYRVYEDEERELVFDIVSDQEGRITEELDLAEEPVDYELVFHTREYLERVHGIQKVNQPMSVALMRVSLSKREKRYHIPLVLSPHSYTVWWSE